MLFWLPPRCSFRLFFFVGNAYSPFWNFLHVFLVYFTSCHSEKQFTPSIELSYTYVRSAEAGLQLLDLKYRLIIFLIYIVSNLSILIQYQDALIVGEEVPTKKSRMKNPCSLALDEIDFFGHNCLENHTVLVLKAFFSLCLAILSCF